MKRRVLWLCLVLWLLCPLRSVAESYELKSDNPQTQQAGEAQVSVGLSYEPRKWLAIGFSEQARFSTTQKIKSFTQLGVDFRTCKYLTLGVDYTLIYSHKQDKDRLKHRVGASAMLRLKTGNWTFSLRERPLLTMRFDSINSAEKNKYDWRLRSRLAVQYNLRSRQIKPYLSLDLENTLNAKAITGYVDQADTRTFYDFKGNYISMVRPTIGVKYQPAKHHQLNFYYRFSADFDRDYNITKKDSKLEVTREREFTHVIGVAYNFIIKK